MWETCQTCPFCGIANGTANASLSVVGPREGHTTKGVDVTTSDATHEEIEENHVNTSSSTSTTTTIIEFENHVASPKTTTTIEFEDFDSDGCDMGNKPLALLSVLALASTLFRAL